MCVTSLLFIVGLNIIRYFIIFKRSMDIKCTNMHFLLRAWCIKYIILLDNLNVVLVYNSIRGEFKF